MANDTCKTLRDGETSGFLCQPKTILDCESETSKHLSASARHSAKIRAPFLVETQKEFVQPFSQFLRTGWNRKFGYKLGVIFSRKFESSFSNVSKRVRGFHPVSKREKHLKSRGHRPSGFIVFERLKTG